MTIYILLSSVCVYRNEKLDYSMFNVYEKAFRTRKEAIEYIDTIEETVRVGKLIQRFRANCYEEARTYIKETGDEEYILTKMYFSIKEETV